MTTFKNHNLKQVNGLVIGHCILIFCEKEFIGYICNSKETYPFLWHYTYLKDIQEADIFCKKCNQLLMSKEDQETVVHILKIASLECVYKYLATSEK